MQGNKRGRVLTGIRPTGRLHLGHYVGALKQWIPLQDDYECFFLIADVQALTTHAGNRELIERSVREVVLDFMAVGLDGSRDNVYFVLQSAVPALTELTTYLSMVTPQTWIDSNPTITRRTDVTVGFMTYPVSQAADITLFSGDPKTHPGESILVPVGEDQIPHLKSTNDIVNAFHRMYGPVVLMQCAPKVSNIGRLVGTDGQGKMSKSMDNVIELADLTEAVRKKVQGMFTDPKRIRADIPGDTEDNPVFIYHRAFNPNANEVAELTKLYQEGRVGDVEVKARLFAALEMFLAPIRERRHEAEKLHIEGDLLAVGNARARRIGKLTIERVREAMGLNYPNLFNE